MMSHTLHTTSSNDKGSKLSLSYANGPNRLSATPNNECSYYEKPPLVSWYIYSCLVVLQYMFLGIVSKASPWFLLVFILIVACIEIAIYTYYNTEVIAPEFMTTYALSTTTLKVAALMVGRYKLANNISDSSSST